MTVWVNVVLLIGSFLLLGLYIMRVNQTAGLGSEIRDLQERVDHLSVANQQLEYRIADDRAMHTVTRRASILGLTEPVSVRYVSTGPTGVALR
ncbi:MAG: hypothetical protein UY95_C0007G0002 [Parcubacteria group bacterium GW2011_GWA2_56_7]|nr:MAG: hypothetical protein UY95_C0007G0002 [Parcubacteria group bacterium GW2011_GWA2_56_7]